MINLVIEFCLSFSEHCCSVSPYCSPSSTAVGYGSSGGTLSARPPVRLQTSPLSPPPIRYYLTQSPSSIQMAAGTSPSNGVPAECPDSLQVRQAPQGEESHSPAVSPCLDGLRPHDLRNFPLLSRLISPVPADKVTTFSPCKCNGLCKCMFCLSCRLYLKLERRCFFPKVCLCGDLSNSIYLLRAPRVSVPLGFHSWARAAPYKLQCDPLIYPVAVAVHQPAW